LFKTVDSSLFKERIQQKKLDLYRQKAQEAWEEEQRKYDEKERQKSKIAAEQEKENRARIKMTNKRRERRTLLAQKKTLQEKRKALGIFSIKDKKRIDTEIVDIERKLETY
jgi:hypothetical protein